MKIARGADWLVITRLGNMSGKKQSRLEDLREDNALFRDLCPLTEQLRSVWKASGETGAKARLQAVEGMFREVAKAHSFAPALKFAEMLKRRGKGIVSACVVGLGTNILEGASNTAKVIKRVACGYRDFGYFALKLMDEFPGKSRKASSGKGITGFNLYWDGSTKSLAFPS